MKLRSGLVCSVILSLAAVACGGESAATPPPATPPTTNSAPATAAAAPSLPAAIQAPSSQSVLMKVNAKGVQIYACKPKADNATAFEWALKAPDAELTDESGQKVGKHYAGPTWEANDGSKVVGQKKAQVDATEPGAVPWLLLEAKSNEGQGRMSGVASIQRVATSGGKAPADGCDAAHAGAEVKVPYTAVYYFNGAPAK